MICTHDDVDNFDWVTARGQCTARNVFEAFKVAVEADVGTRSELDPNHGTGFKFRNASDDWFSVLVPTVCEIVFQRNNDSITVTRKDIKGENPMLTAVVRMNESGDCVFIVDDDELSSWQLRRLALEDAFFG